jgi:hypothetical protein
LGKSTFEIGVKEKHILTVDRDPVMKHIRIELDGEKLADEYIYSLGAKKFSFDIGSSEVHKVEVSLGMALPLVAFVKGRTLKVLVDGKPAAGSGGH